MIGSGLVGVLIGLALGVVNYGIIGKLAERVEKAEMRSVLQTVALIDLVVFPVAGYVIGAYLWA